jgi:hypothetical protein
MKNTAAFIKAAGEQAPGAYSNLNRWLLDRGIDMLSLPLMAVVTPAAQYCLMEGR